ncbi:MAG: YeeE/YedE thiosulfate transporter family protein [Syntrophothermus sp.]
MGPLVPDLIGNELNMIVALFIGILFGLILEQAGFSTSKKLVGLFYGYDFTVLRVFFTAGIVAMIGVIAFEHYGLLDISLVYVNPSFLWSAIIGGLIMGLGFVIGGFCPGTSICAAAIGKIDAIIFIAGSFIGVLVFAEGYPLFEGLYKAANMGNVRIFETLGIPQSVFAFALTAMALAAFWVTSIIENKINGVVRPPVRITPYYASLALIGGAIALSAFILPERKEALLEKTGDAAFVNSHSISTITPDELSFRLMEKDKNLQLFDFRSAKEFSKFHLPQSASYLPASLFEKETAKLLLTRHKLNVFMAEDESSARKLAAVADELGYDKVKVLGGGMNNFRKQIMEFDTLQSAQNSREADTFRFRAKARKTIPLLIEQSKSTLSVKKTAKRVVGGC